MQLLKNRLAHTGSFEDCNIGNYLLDDRDSFTEQRNSRKRHKMSSLEPSNSFKTSDRRISDNVKLTTHLEEPRTDSESRIPMCKGSDSYKQKFPRKKKSKTNSINYMKAKEKLAPNSSRHSRGNSRTNMVAQQDSCPNLIAQKAARPKKSSKSKERKDSKPIVKSMDFV